MSFSEYMSYRWTECFINLGCGVAILIVYFTVRLFWKKKS